MLSCRKSTFEQDVRNVLKGGSTGAGCGMFQTGKFGEEGADVGMAGKQSSEKGKVSCLQGGGDGVGERKSGCRGKETGTTDRGLGRDLAVESRVES